MQPGPAIPPRQCDDTIEIRMDLSYPTVTQTHDEKQGKFSTYTRPNSPQTTRCCIHLLLILSPVVLRYYNEVYPWGNYETRRALIIIIVQYLCVYDINIIYLIIYFEVLTYSIFEVHHKTLYPHE